MYFRIPIPYPGIKDKDDHQVVAWLLKRIGWATNEFLYGKCYPIFKALYVKFYTDSSDIMDFIHDIYVDIIGDRKRSDTCKLQTFNYQSSLYTWMGVVSSRYCFLKYKKQIYTDSLDDGDRNFEILVSNPINENIFDRDDLEKIMNMIANDRYRQLIQLRYMQGLSNEETALQLNMSMDVYYNKHRLAKVRFVSALKKEGLL